MKTNTNSIFQISAARVRREVDNLVALQLQIKTLEAKASVIKTALKTLGDGFYEGSEHTAQVVTGPVSRLDTAAVKARLSPAQYVECVVTSDVTRVLIK